MTAKNARLNKIAIPLLLIGLLISLVVAVPVFGDEQAEHPFQYGDVNNDGKINVTDAIMVLRHIVGLINLGDEDEDHYEFAQYAAAVTDEYDSDEGKLINVSDAIQILRAIVDLIDPSEFPAQKRLDEAEGQLLDAINDGDLDAANGAIEFLPPIPPVIEMGKSIEVLEEILAAESLDDIDAIEESIDELPDGDTKDALQARLDALKALIEATDAIDALPDLTDEGIAAVEDAAAGIAAARGLVEAALALGADEADIDNLADLVTAEAFVAALDAVKAAEDSRDADDIADAQGLIDGLPDGDTKDALQDRLDDLVKAMAIDAAIDAIDALPDLTDEGIDAIEDAAADIAAARGLVEAALALGADEADIDNLADLVTAEAFVAALEAVKAAEDSRNAADVGVAQGLIDGLPGGDTKDALQARLDALKALIEAIDAAIDAIDALPDLTDEGIDAIEDAAADIAAARGLVEAALALGADEADIDNLADLVTAEAFVAALDAVKAAEDSRNADDIADAQGLIDELLDGDTKDALQGHLDELVKDIAIDAATAAINVLPDLTDEGIDAVEDAAAGIAAARGLVEAALALGADEADIDNLADLVTAEAFVAALDAVKAAEDSRDADDIADAQGLIDGLPDGDTKDALQDRLDDLVKAMAIDAAIDAIDALPDLTDEGIDAIEDAAADIAAARGLVEAALALGADEADIDNLADLVTAEAFVAALDAVKAAEDSRDADDIADAQGLIDGLPDGDTKDALQDRLDDLVKAMAIDAAIDAIDALPDLTDEGIDAIEDAAADIAAARGLVEAALALGADEADIDNLADLVTAEAFVAALDAVKAAEDSRNADDIADAQGLIDELLDGDTKDALQGHLDELVKDIAIDAATAAINVLPDLTDEGIDAVEDAAAGIAAARGLVEAALALGADEADIDNLADLVTAEAFVAALEAVKAAEDSRDADDIADAQGLIDGLPDGDTKDALQDRLDDLVKAMAIDAAIDAIDALPDLTDEGIDAIEDAAADIAAARGLVEAALALGADEADIDNLADLVTAEAFVAALEAVKAAEDSRNAADVGVAQGLIDELPDGDTKDALQDRLDDVDVFTEGLLVHSVGFSDKTGVLYKRGNDLYYNSIGSDGKWGSEALISEGGTQGRLAIDSDGNPHVVYVTKATNGKDAIGYRMYDGSDWTEEEQIVSNDFGKTGECSKPDIAVDSEGNAHITYTDTMGSDKDPYEEDDIMYATNSGGTFENTLVYRGYKSYVENYGSETGQDAHYYKKGSFITVDSQNNYCILSFYNYWNRYGRDRYNTYAIVATTATTSEGGGGSFSVSANSDIYDLAYDDEENRIVALFMDNDVVKIAEIVESGGNVSFDNIEDLTGASEVHSIAAADGNIVVGGVDGGNLQIYCNGVEVSFDEDIPVFSNSRVTVVYTGGDFYAVYTDSENTIQRQLIEL